MLWCGTVRVDIREGLSDEDVAKLFCDGSLGPQSFLTCSYSQRFGIVKSCEEMMGKNSRQGKRTDLEEISIEKIKGTCVQPVSNFVDYENTCVQLVSNSSGRSRRPTIRNRVASLLGISASTLSKYRRIIKLPGHLLQTIANLLDEKRITFEAAYIISNITDKYIGFLIEEINHRPGEKLNLDKLKELPKRNEKSKLVYPIPDNRVQEAFLSPKYQTANGDAIS